MQTINQLLITQADNIIVTVWLVAGKSNSTVIQTQLKNAPM